MDFLTQARNLKSYMVELRNYFHSHPELSLQEFNTCKKIQEELDSLKIKNYRISGTNVIAELDTLRPGKTLFLRADIDALPVQEKNEVPYKSQTPGVMHACGHDGHIAYMLATARILKENLSQFSGKIIIAFQAAEEIGKGAREIIDSGILDKVDRVFGIHLLSSIPLGKIAVKSGALSSSCDRFYIKINGKSGHITAPQKCVDPIFIASLITAQLQTVVSRLISPAEGGLIGVGKINGGSAYNVIPENCSMEGTIRAFSDDSRKKMNNAVTKIAENIAEEYGGTAEVKIEDLCDACFNDEQATLEAALSSRKIVGEENTLTSTEKLFWSDNFADFYRKAKGCYVYVGSCSGESTAWAHHNEHFDIAPDCMVYAAALAAQYAADFLKE